MRVLPPLTHRLAEAMPGFATALAPIVEHVAQMIGSASPYDVSQPSILTKEKHKAAARRRVESSVESLPTNTPRGPGVAGLRPRMKRRQRPLPETNLHFPSPSAEAVEPCSNVNQTEFDGGVPTARSV